MAVQAEEALPVQVERERTDWLYRWMTTVDHKRIGILYLWTTLGFFLIGGLEALAIRLQLAVPNARVLSPELYNQFFTMHGLTMIFLVVMPVLIGFGNYFVPLMIGAHDMVFPRLNALSYWLLLFGGLLLYFSFAAGGAPDTGWTNYAPLNERNFFSPGVGVDYWIIGLLVTGIGSIVGAVNLVVTILGLRAPGMTMMRLPLFVWTVLIAALLILWAMPALTVAMVLLLFDRHLGTAFFNPAGGGDPVLYQHLFWFLGHPEVYIMILPGFGIISEVIPVFSRKPIFGYPFIAGSTLAIGFYSMLVWAHHMFTSGLGPVLNSVFAASSMLIAVPTGVKIFNWIATMWGGTIRFTTAMLFAVGFLANFILGGLTGVIVAVVPVDWQVHDTYFVVAHLHYVLFGGSILSIFSGVYYWFPKISGRMLSERLGVWHFWFMMVGLTLTFLPMHFLGLIGMPRRIYTYGAESGWGPLNFIQTVGAVVLTIGLLIFLWNLFSSLRRGKLAGPDPWDAWTFEWATASPPPPHNFDTLPVVKSRRPLWDLKHPDDPDWQRRH